MIVILTCPFDPIPALSQSENNDSIRFINLQRTGIRVEVR